jgi:hypothetical protein
MSAPLRLSESEPSTERDPIAVWLDTLGVLLRMPGMKSAPIRDELENHLRERVRDLMLTGKGESEAVRTAIGELGDAVKLAERLRAAGQGPRRRHIMAGVAIFGVAGAALVTSLVALQQGGSESIVERALVPGQWEVVRSPYLPQPPNQPKNLRVSISPTMTFREFAKQVSDKAGVPAVTHWKTLEAADIGMERNLDVEASLTDLPLTEALGYINEALNQEHNGLDYRLENNRLTLATIEYFDKQESVLVAYDLSAQVAERARLLESKSILEVTEQVTQQVSGVIQALVHSELWQNNGGDRASIAVYGSKLFIRAPKRFHPEIEWVLGQLSEQKTVTGAITGDVPLMSAARSAVIQELVQERPGHVDPRSVKPVTPR